MPFVPFVVNDRCCMRMKKRDDLPVVALVLFSLVIMGRIVHIIRRMLVPADGEII